MLWLACLIETIKMNATHISNSFNCTRIIIRSLITCVRPHCAHCSGWRKKWNSMARGNRNERHLNSYSTYDGYMIRSTQYNVWFVFYIRLLQFVLIKCGRREYCWADWLKSSNYVNSVWLRFFSYCFVCAFFLYKCKQWTYAKLCKRCGEEGIHYI